MEITRTDLPKSRVKLMIEVPTKEMAVFFAAAYEQLGQGVEIGGFRRGKAPGPLVREHLGASRILAAAIDAAVPDTYQRALDKEELIPVGEPAIEVTKAGEDEPLAYTAEVDVLPRVSVGRYDKVRVNAKTYAAEAVKPEAVKQATTSLLRRFATPKPVGRPAAPGDWVEVSYTGTIGGVVQEGLQSQHHPLVLGEGTFIPAFEKQLIGMGTGEQRTFTVDVPQGTGRSQSTEFRVMLDAVSELMIPELTDAFAKKFKKTSAAELTKAIEDDLRTHAEAAARSRLEQAVLAAVVKGARVELPESLIEREVSRRISTLSEQLQMAGRTIDQWLAGQKKDRAGFRTEIRPAAEQAVRTSLVLRAIAEQEGLIQAGAPATQEALKKTVDVLVARATK